MTEILMKVALKPQSNKQNLQYWSNCCNNFYMIFYWFFRMCQRMMILSQTGCLRCHLLQIQLRYEAELILCFYLSSNYGILVIQLMISSVLHKPMQDFRYSVRFYVCSKNKNKEVRMFLADLLIRILESNCLRCLCTLSSHLFLKCFPLKLQNYLKPDSKIIVFNLIC